MTILEIPKRYYPGFRYLISLTDSDMRRLVKELGEIQASMHPKKVPEILSENLDLPRSNMTEVVDVLVSLFRLRESYDGDLSSLVDGIVIALEETKDKDLQPRESFKVALGNLLDLRGPLFYSFKGVDLSTERHKVLGNARIYTDIRPVFSEDKDYKIESSVITHSLKIEYYEGGKYREIYFAIDGSDLKNLSRIIERAQNKEIAIKKQYSDLGMSILDN